MNSFLFSCLHVVCRQFLPKMPHGALAQGRKLCATYANVPSVTNIEKTCIYGTFGTEMPHGTLAQVAQTSYMKGEFLYQLFIIMSINLHGGDSLLSRLEIFRSE